MKKILVLAVGVVMMLALTACGSPTEEQPEEQIDYEIALVTDAGLIMDGGYSEVAWNAISEFGAENGVSHKYYKAAEATEESYRFAIDEAASKGAKVIIADGYLFEDVIYDAQSKYKDINFILIDAEPVNPQTGKAKIADNTTALIFASEEAGYMAGYAAVENGYSQLGFIGEADKSVYKDYGYGFLQGANAAAVRKGVYVNVKYHSCEESDDRKAVFEKAETWYEDGTEVIFACGPKVELPIIEAAELNEKKVIACETDKSEMSDIIVTSVIKDIPGAIEDSLQKYIKNKFPGGVVTEYDVATDSIWIDMETSRLVFFNESDYRELKRTLKNKSVEISDHTVGKIGNLKLSNVSYVKE